MADLLDDVHIDGKHSLEDTIDDVCEVRMPGSQALELMWIFVPSLKSQSASSTNLACCQPGAANAGTATRSPLTSRLRIATMLMKAGAFKRNGRSD
jgi:hypothetical protein